MSSQSLASLVEALKEIDYLQQANPSPYGAVPAQPNVTRTIGRSSVVLLSSHFERYFYRVNEEAVDVVNVTAITGQRLSELLRLVHSRSVVDDLAKIAWEKRADKLMEFTLTEAWLWDSQSTGALEHNRILAWMKTPKPGEIKRFYKYWGIEDIFGAITKTPHAKTHFWLKLTELVDKRNNIAHGDLTTEATQADVKVYTDVVKNFCTRADRALARQIARSLAISRPW